MFYSTLCRFFVVTLFVLLGIAPATHATTVVPIPKDMVNIVWLHTDVSSWQETANLSSVTIGPSTTTLNYSKTSTWPGVAMTASHGGIINLNANPWIFVYRNGTWYAATWEWMQVGQTVKSTSSIRGDHIKKAPLDTFYPVKGEVYGFMVSGLARDKTRNVQERSNVVMATWPLDTIYPCTAAPVISTFTITNNSDPALRNNPVLSWAIENANSASISPLVGAISPTTQGSTTTTVTEPLSTFTLTATNDCGTSTQTTSYTIPSITGPLHMLLFSNEPRR